MAEQVVFQTVCLITHGFEGTAPRIWSVTTDQTLSVLLTPGSVASFISYNRLKAQDILYVNYDMDGTPGNAKFFVTATEGGSLTLANDISVSIPVTSAEFLGMYATPKLLVAAPGSGLFLALKSAFVSMEYGTTTYAGGGLVNIQYTNIVNGDGYWATTDTEASAFEQEESIILNMHPSFPTATDFTWTTDQIGNQGLYLSNQTGAFTTGDGDFLVHLSYSIART